MRHKLPFLAAVLGVLLASSGAMLYWGGQASAQDPTPTPVPAECDIEASLGSVSPASLSLKVGDAPADVDLTGSWTNLGHVSPGAGDATCKVLLIMGAEADQDLNGVYEPIPAGLSVRVEPQIELNPYPSPTPNPYPGGDVCLVCYQTGVGKAISDCLLGSGPIAIPMPDPSTWQYVLAPCEEIDKPFDIVGFGKFMQQADSCRDGIDNDLDLGIDWAGYSPTTPDAACIDVEALVLTPLNPTILAPQASVTESRQVSIQCDARGTYNLILFGSNYGAYLLDGPYGEDNRDPNAANDQQYVPLTVTCRTESVGGIAEYPQTESPSALTAHGSSPPNDFAVAGLATGAALLLTGGALYARRRWRAP